MELFELLYLMGTGLLAVVIALLYKMYNPFNFWEKRGVPYIKPQYPIIGNIRALTKPLHEFAFWMYSSFPKEKFYGSFTLWRPTLIIKDPDLIEHVLIKDFSHFYNRNNTSDVETNELSKHLVNYHDEKWKALRNKLTPTFTTGKLKGMHPQVTGCAESLVKYLAQFEKNDEVNIKELCGRFSMDVVASCAFGLDLDIMNNPESELLQIGKQTFAPNYLIKCFFLLQQFLAPVYKRFRLGLLPKKMTSFFVNAVDEMLEYREKNNVKRPDFLHLLNELKKRDDELIEKKELDPNDPAVFDHNTVVSNAFIFFAAGYETTGTTMSYVFYELALNQDVQEKLFQEIIEVLGKHNSELTFDAVGEMKYLEQVLSESLRMHTPAGILDRKVNKDYKIPGSDIFLPAGCQVAIPVLGMHYDPQYFPEPEKFNPERFDEEKNVIQKGTYLPFGGGPRICIAARFAKIEAKVGIALVVKQFKIRRCSKTKVPIEYDGRSFLLVPKNGIYLSFEKRAAPVA